MSAADRNGAIGAVQGWALKRIKSRLPVVGWLGDSRTDVSTDVTSAYRRWTNNSYVNWVRWGCRQRFYTDQQLVFAVSGQGTAHVLNTQVPAAIAAGVQIAMVHIGINDIGVLTLAQMCANMDAILTRLNDAGIVVVLVPVTPINLNGTTGSDLSATNLRQQVDAYNRYLWAQSQRPLRNVLFADVWPDLVDYSTGYSASDNLYDGLHDNPTSAQKMARAVCTVLNAILPPCEYPVASAADAFDPVLAPNGNLIINGLMNGTTGTLSNSATGTVATNWNGRKTVTSTITAAFSKGTHPDHPTLNTSIMTLGGVADGAGAELNRTITTPTGLVAGMRVYMECEAKWTGIANVRGIYPRMTVSDGTTTFESIDGVWNTGKGEIINDGEAYFRTEPITLPNNFNTLTARLTATTNTGGGTAAGVITWWRAAIRVADQFGPTGI